MEDIEEYYTEKNVDYDFLQKMDQGNILVICLVRCQ